LKLRTRFAPSPTGLLHVGNAFSALICQQWAEKHHADLFLRIEDIDHTRCKPELQQQLIDDLTWLGIHWQGDITKQSNRHKAYRKALKKLHDLGVIYPCFCTRKHIQQEIERMRSAPHTDPPHTAPPYADLSHANDYSDPYPGICRNIDKSQSEIKMKHEPFAWRLHITKAMELINAPIGWNDQHGHFHAASPALFGDTVIGRKDIEFSYHLAVVVDDAKQKITHIIRGKDLFSSTPIHCLLQHLLGLPTPIYIHHALLVDTQGERLAKRHQSTSLKSLKDAGCDSKLLRQFLLKRDPPVWPFADTDSINIIEQLGRKA